MSSILIDVASCKTGLEAFDLLCKQISMKQIKSDRGSYVVHTDGSVLWKNAQPKKLQSGEWGAIIAVQRNSSKPEKGEFVTVTKRDGTTFEAEITKVVSSNNFGITVETNHKEEPSAQKSINDLSESQLIAEMKNWDNVQNEGYSDDGQYNPYRDELRKRYANGDIGSKNKEQSPVSMMLPEKKDYNFSIPSDANHLLAGKTVKNGVLVKKDGEDMILFANQNPSTDKTKANGDLYIRIKGKPELERLVMEQRERQSKATMLLATGSNEQKELYRKAIMQINNAGWADNVGKIPAAEKAIDILLSGGSVEDAQIALNSRRDFVD